MGDYLVKALGYKDNVRLYTVNMTETIREIQEKLDTWSASTAALGRSLIATALFSKKLKGEERLSIQVRGDGLGGAIVTEGTADGYVRGYIAEPHLTLPPNDKGKIDVRRVVGTKGSITVVKDLLMKEPFSGQIPIVDGELGVDFTYYMAVSEQINGAMGLSVYVDVDNSVISAGGFMIELLPGADEETVNELEVILNQLPALSDFMSANPKPEDLVKEIFKNTDSHILSQEAIAYRCNCSKDIFARGLISIGEKELQAMIDEDHGAEAVCHFCHNAYQFTEEELRDLIHVIQEKKARNEGSED
ncbi:Hsp33 family molecular chaperone HslO [Atopobacter sp. AH10]|uniref:Hsp33 family molecular chaperone HslO n=1 Tax=Atopobacter sp. AH10 TaxID=2315861 RepID=UPI000EF277A3|nr:Hsp33 family molecular chaperone HslO [Atopobacter sp. AH10]RLK63614.1 Hsp33 family molecular chaperone HslO [Atopobacter sp. AH10]